MRAMVLALALLAGCCVMVEAVAAGAPRARVQARKSIESSLRLTGEVVIDVEGRVAHYSIDKNTLIAPALLQLMDDTVHQWRFQPVMEDGKAVQTSTKMAVLLVARQVDGSERVRVAHASFGRAAEAEDPSRVSTDYPTSKRMDPPEYPLVLQHMGARGTAYAVVRFGRDGKVTDVLIEQVNLRSIGSASQMDGVRREFARATQRAAKRWEFTPPTTGDNSGKDRWLVRVPVTYCLDDLVCGPTYGQWDTYLPGPRVTPPSWASDALHTAGAPDAMPDRGVFSLDLVAPRLITPLDG